jgi:hypothetical protein
MHRLLAVVVLGLALPGSAQHYAPLTFAQMTAKAGLIFAGTVTHVELVPGSVPELRTTLRVTRAVRGARLGESITVREWIPPLDPPHYRVGQNVFLFLYGGNTGRLTSPVGGPAGRFAVDANWHVILRPDQTHLIKAVPARTPRGKGARVPIHTFIRALRSAEAR